MQFTFYLEYWKRSSSCLKQHLGTPLFLAYLKALNVQFASNTTWQHQDQKLGIATLLCRNILHKMIRSITTQEE